MWKQKQHNADKISEEGDFILWATAQKYKVLQCFEGYYRNIYTKENCGQLVELYKHFYKDGKKLIEPIYDECCYEYVVEVDDNEIVYQCS